MLLGELNSNLLQNLSAIALEGGIQSSITIDNNESEFFVVSKETSQGFSLEFASAEIHKLINRAEGLKIKVDFLLSFAILH
jgi:hypothetical protein